MKNSRFTDSQVDGALKQVKVGLLAPQFCREVGLSLATLYNRRSQVRCCS